MEKETLAPRKPPLPKAPREGEHAVRTMSLEEAKKLIRKVSKDHAALFRRLAE